MTESMAEDLFNSAPPEDYIKVVFAVEAVTPFMILSISVFMSSILEMRSLLLYECVVFVLERFECWLISVIFE